MEKVNYSEMLVKLNNMLQKSAEHSRKSLFFFFLAIFIEESREKEMIKTMYIKWDDW